MNRPPPPRLRRSPPAAPIVLRPWTADDFADSLDLSRLCRPQGFEALPIERHLGRGSPTIGVTAEFWDVFAGYLLFTPAHTSLRILDLAVSSCFRRIGVASTLLAWLVGRLGPCGRDGCRDRIVCEAPEFATDLRLFLRARGFQAVPFADGRYVDEAGGVKMVARLEGPP